MLVDNAIVVTDNAQILIKKGMRRRDALIRGATVPQWGLLGATLIAIFSFLPLYLAPSSVAEMVKPLFIVLAVSLGLSWILALTQTTVFGNFILKENSGDSSKDPYDTKFYHRFVSVLRGLIKYKVITIVSVVCLFLVSMYIMGIMPQNFFPSMDKPYFRAECFLPEGFSIRESEDMMSDIEAYLLDQDEVVNVSVTIGIALAILSGKYIFRAESEFRKSVDRGGKKGTVSDRGGAFEYLRAGELPGYVDSFLFVQVVPGGGGRHRDQTYQGEYIDTLAALTERAMNIMRECDMVSGFRRK